MTPYAPRHRAAQATTYAPTPASHAVGMYSQRATPADSSAHYSFGAGAL